MSGKNAEIDEKVELVSSTLFRSKCVYVLLYVHSEGKSKGNKRKYSEKK